MRAIALLFMSAFICLSANVKAETLQDCLLENLKGVTSDLAAEAITKACNQKFGSTPPSVVSVDSIPQTGKVTLELNKSFFSSERPVYEIPVPEGNWQKVGEWKRNNFQPALIVEIWVDVVDKKLRNMLYVTYNKGGNQYGWKSGKVCDRKNLHYIVRNRNNDSGRQDCYGVNHFRISGDSGKNKAVNQSKEWARENGVQFPTTLITHFHRFADKKLLDFWVGINPEFDGFSPPVDSNWSSNDWHQDIIIGDSERLAYIERVKKIADEVHPVMQEQFGF